MKKSEKPRQLWLKSVFSLKTTHSLGRRPIFLNGAILGMSRVEIKKKFDEIVAFAEIEKFLDTPVKRYSSGMYVRLVFAKSPTSWRLPK